MKSRRAGLTGKPSIIRNRTADAVAGLGLVALLGIDWRLPGATHSAGLWIGLSAVQPTNKQSGTEIRHGRDSPAAAQRHILGGARALKGYWPR